MLQNIAMYFTSKGFTIYHFDMGLLFATTGLIIRSDETSKWAFCCLDLQFAILSSLETTRVDLTTNKK